MPGHRLALDLRDPDSCDAAIRAAVEHAGKLDVVVNAAGVVAFGPIEELSVDTMEELFMTNTFVPILLAKAALGALTEGGITVNLSGVIAEQNLPGMAAYGASKAAARSLTKRSPARRVAAKFGSSNARPPHTETGLADRPIEGQAPKMPMGLDPVAVAAIICDAIAGDIADLPSTSFTS